MTIDNLNPAPTEPSPPRYLSSKTDLGITAVAFSGGQAKLGVDIGPKELIKAGLLTSLSEDLEYTLHWDRLVHAYPDLLPAHDPRVDNMLTPLSVSAVTKRLSEQVYDHAIQGRLTLTLGGDHSIAMGSVFGSAKAIHERTGKKLGLIWVDAHADINTPATSGSGNIHGMPVAFLAGIAKHPLFAWMQDQVVGKRGVIDTSRIVYIGLRDVDKGEKRILREEGIRAFSMHDVDRHGIGKVVDMALDYLRDEEGDTGPLYLSFDVDALDPSFAAATGTPVRGGLTLREGDFICECIHETGNLVGVDLVEVNPVEDRSGGAIAEETVRNAVSLVRCALGESLL
ncbi:arginase [Ascobolus immersus RN42]|uniref:Arginase n=1 Tax=Ascobolus immersus RN42 TaxID=1160509 RepID=A0A3N4HFW6_ASCIM|nr:arginase [Ascobolus immersus RN42]